MSLTISAKAKKITWLLAMVYFASYLMRKNFSVMLAAITASGFDPVALGVVGSAMTISYGAGQIVNGILGDKIKPQYMLTCGLFLAAACNFAMSFCTTVTLMAVVWFVNGFAHAMLWPPIVRLMAMHMNDTEYGYAAVRISAASSIATIVLYLLSPVLLKVMDWNKVILCIGFAGVAIAVAWVLLNPRLFQKEGASLPTADGAEEAAAPADAKKNVPLPAMVWLPIVLIFLGIVLQGALRDGVGDWMPTYMAQAFELDPENAIITGVVPAIFSIISFTAFDLLHRKLLKNEVTCAAVIFVGSTVCAGLLLMLNLLGVSGWGAAILSALLIGVLVACMHGINLMLITVVPKRFIKSGKVSTFSGLLNAGTYVGAAVALPLFPALAENFDWNATIIAWAVIAALGAIVCFAVVPLWTKFRKEYSDNPEV
ncbi:MAG: MFS transporter [Clostridia bacterium]|nr:MFS transporter [Clostridia bacterium]